MAKIQKRVLSISDGEQLECAYTLLLAGVHTWVTTLENHFAAEPISTL